MTCLILQKENEFYMKEDIFNSVCAFLGSFIVWFWGGADNSIYILVALSTMDYVSGVLAAGVLHKLSSAIGFKGIAGKIYIFILVGITNVIGRELLGEHAGLLREAVIFFYIANEGISILENACHIGIPIPAVLKKLLEKIKDNSDKAD